MSTQERPSPRDVVVLVGNPAPESRTRSVAELVAGSIGQDRTQPDLRPVTVELSDYTGSVFNRDDAYVAAARELVTNAAVLIVATPVYKGSFTGLLKAFLDGVSAGALTRTVLSS